ncbi:MAG: Na+/H+ antiporter NhaC family protein [Anaerovoracaceae bacterium]
MESYGFISLLPVLVILVIAVTTKKTLFAMTCGLTVGAVILAGANDGFVNSWFNYVYASMSNESFQWIALVVAMFGMLIVLFERSDAVKDFGIWAGKFVKTKKQSLFATAILGVIIFLDDYLNNLAVGTTMKGITDRLGVPRTQLAYVVNTVAAPVCLLIPLSSWAAYFAMLLENEGITVNGSGMGAYLKALPLTFYAYLAVIVCVLQIIGIIPKMGQIKKDYARYEATGDVFPEGTERELIEAEENVQLQSEDKKVHPWNFLIPLIVMIVVTLLAGTEVLIGSAAGVVTAFVLYLIEKKMSFTELLTACYDGIVSMSFVMILTVLAFAVQSVNLDLGLADYVISVTEPIMKGAFLPAVVFIVCGIYAYATGCFWDLAAIILPIVIPLAQAMGVDPILASAAVFSGAAFGSNTCLYGDGVIMCSQGCEIKSMDLMFASLPYASIAAAGSVILYLICGFVM